MHRPETLEVILDGRRTASAKPIGVWGQGAREARRSHLPARRSMATSDAAQSHAIRLRV